VPENIGRGYWSIGENSGYALFGLLDEVESEAEAVGGDATNKESVWYGDA